MSLDGTVAVIVSLVALALQGWNAWMHASVRAALLTSEQRTMEKVDAKLDAYVLERICVARSCRAADCPILHPQQHMQPQ